MGTQAGAGRIRPSAFPIPLMSQPPIDPPQTAGTAAGAANADASSRAGGWMADAADETLSTTELLSQLREDRLWLLRQLDGGQWPEWRLDLAALERELGQLLDQIEERRGLG